MVKCVKIPIKDAQKVKKCLLQNNHINHKYRANKEGEHIYFPVQEQFSCTCKYEVLDKEMPASIKEEISAKPFREVLAEILTKEELEEAKTAYDHMGGIAIIEVPDTLEHKEKEIAETLLQSNPHIETVLKKDGNHEGVFRSQKMKYLAGKENYEKLKEQFSEYIIIPCSAEAELALREAGKKELINYVPGDVNFSITEQGKEQLNEKQQQALEFVKQTILNTYTTGTGIQEVLNKVVFDILEMKAIHPGGVAKLEDQHGNCLPDCFLMKNDATALDFAYRLHSDFGDNFVKAIDVKSKLPVGRDHVLKHLDIIEIMSSK